LRILIGHGINEFKHILESGDQTILFSRAVQIVLRGEVVGLDLFEGAFENVASGLVLGRFRQLSIVATVHNNEFLVFRHPNIELDHLNSFADSPFEGSKGVLGLFEASAMGANNQGLARLEQRIDGVVILIVIGVEARQLVFFTLERC